MLMFYHSEGDAVPDFFNLFANSAKEYIAELSSDDHNGVNRCVLEIH